MIGALNDAQCIIETSFENAVYNAATCFRLLLRSLLDCFFDFFCADFILFLITRIKYYQFFAGHVISQLTNYNGHTYEIHHIRKA